VTHEYPPNRAFDSVSISRVAALREYGLTLRQREFLVTVMVHSGCFLERQYCEFTGTVRGQNSREFVARLVARGFARAIEPGPARRGRLYHVHHKPLYEAIGQADLDVSRLCPRHILRIAPSACRARFQSSPSGHDSSAAPHNIAFRLLRRHAARESAHLTRDRANSLRRVVSKTKRR